MHRFHSSKSATLLVALATVGMLLPSAALPCCGCCVDDVAKQSECHAESERSTCSRTCCSSNAPKCCSVEQSPSDLCCTGSHDCDKPECRCNTLPTSAALVTSRDSSQPNPAFEQLLAAAAPHIAIADASRCTYSNEQVSPPPLSGVSRLHAQLCVWRN